MKAKIRKIEYERYNLIIKIKPILSLQLSPEELGWKDRKIAELTVELLESEAFSGSPNFSEAFKLTKKAPEVLRQLKSIRSLQKETKDLLP